MRLRVISESFSQPPIDHPICRSGRAALDAEENMEPGKKSVFRTQINMVPFVAISVSMVAVVIVAMLLLVSVTSVKNDNEALKSNVDSLKSTVESLNQKLMEMQNAQVVNESQEDTFTQELQGIKARTDALEALQGQFGQADPGLAIASFDLKLVANPGYSYQTYAGTGAITAADAKDSFLVLLKKTLKSGGAPTTKKLEYLLVLVVDGSGAFYTDDSAEGTVAKPEYEFAIVGSVRIDAGGQKGE
jgi:biopolymer transport protein ExbD